MKSEEAVADDFEQRCTDNSVYHVAPDLIEATVLDFDNWPGLDGRDLNTAVHRSLEASGVLFEVANPCAGRSLTFLPAIASVLRRCRR